MRGLKILLITISFFSFTIMSALAQKTPEDLGISIFNSFKTKSPLALSKLLSDTSLPNKVLRPLFLIQQKFDISEYEGAAELSSAYIQASTVEQYFKVVEKFKAFNINESNIVFKRFEMDTAEDSKYYGKENFPFLQQIKDAYIFFENRDTSYCIKMNSMMQFGGIWYPGNFSYNPVRRAATITEFEANEFYNETRDSIVAAFDSVNASLDSTVAYKDYYGDDYKVISYSGKIGSKVIKFSLHFYLNKPSYASYYFISDGKAVTLSVNKNKSDYIFIDEPYTGYMILKKSATSLTGKWISADGKKQLPVNLKKIN